MPTKDQLREALAGLLHVVDTRGLETLDPESARAIVKARAALASPAPQPAAPAPARGSCRDRTCPKVTMFREADRLVALLGPGWLVEASYHPPGGHCLLFAIEAEQAGS